MPIGTAFTYQGKLSAGGQPANGSVVGGPLTNSATGVTNGLFTVLLDFRTNIFTGDARWLAIEVKTNGGGTFILLTPRQQLTPTPYALYAPTAGTARQRRHGHHRRECRRWFRSKQQPGRWRRNH